MPLLAGKRNIGRNVTEMERAGHPHNQAVAAALHKAGVKRKDPPMKSKSMIHEAGMAGEMGMSPRKAMASGKIGGGNFGTSSYAEMNGGGMAHPDHSAGTGMKGTMGDGDRATPPGIHHTKGHMPAQAAPRHGPHHPGGHGDDWSRGGAV
jgi:hypothetical protein